MSTRACAVAMLAALAVPVAVLAAPSAAKPAPGKREPREMQVYKVAPLGLMIWVENQPPWEVDVSEQPGRPMLVAQSPSGYHPPTVMTYMSFPNERVADGLIQGTALSAIRRASLNFGLTEGQSRSINPTAATYGVLRGYEAVFIGRAHGELVDVQIFVGQETGRFPVVLTMYTMRDKLPNLVEQRRRAWTKLTYLE